MILYLKYMLRQKLGKIDLCLTFWYTRILGAKVASRVRNAIRVVIESNPAVLKLKYKICHKFLTSISWRTVLGPTIRWNGGILKG